MLGMAPNCRSLPLLASLALSTLSPAVLLGQASPSTAGTAALLAELSHTRRVGAVALSPDGRLVAMQAAGSLLIAPISNGDASRPVPLTLGRGCELTSLTWSPDSAHLALLSECPGSAQVLTTTPAAAAPQLLATLPGFAKSLEYAPDGRSLGLLYVPGATRPSGALAAMKPPSGEIGVEGLEVQRAAAVDATTGALTLLTPAALHVYEFSYSPDAQQIAFVAAAPPGENNWWISKLYTKPVDPNAQAEVLLDPNRVAGPLHGLQIAVPRWSPEGKRLAFIGGLMSDQGATGGDLYELSAVPGATPVRIPVAEHATVQWIHFLPSGELLATEVRGGAEAIAAISATFPPDFQAPGGTRVLTANHFEEKLLLPLSASVGDGRLAGSFALSSTGEVAAWSASSYDQAPEVYAGRLDGHPLPAITHLNTDLKPIWGKTESITWTNDTLQVQGWLHYPSHYDPAKKYGLIVMVHGGPSSAVTPRWPRAGFGAAPLAAAGYFVLEPNPRGSYGQGEAFTQANRKDFGYGDLRDILAGVDAAEKQVPAIDDARLGLTGWSYGGFMTMFSVTQTHRFKAAVAGAGIANWLSYYGENSIDQWMTPFFGATVYQSPEVYARSSAINYIRQVSTPTLVVVGDRDGECPAPQSFEFWHALKAFNVPTTLVVYPNEGHGFVDPAHQHDVLDRSIRWFDQYLR